MCFLHTNRVWTPCIWKCSLWSSPKKELLLAYHKARMFCCNLMMNDPRKWAPITHSGLIGHFYVQKISNCFVQKINTGFVQKINTGSIGSRSILHWFSLSVSLSVTQNQCLFQKVSAISALFITYMSIHITFRKLENPRYQGQAGKKSLFLYSLL